MVPSVRERRSPRSSRCQSARYPSGRWVNRERSGQGCEPGVEVADEERDGALCSTTCTGLPPGDAQHVGLEGAIEVLAGRLDARDGGAGAEQKVLRPPRRSEERRVG